MIACDPPTASTQSRRQWLQAGLLGAGVGAIARLGESSGNTSADAPDEGLIDAHVHVWTPDTKQYPLRTDFPKEQMQPASFTPEQFFAHARPLGVSRAVLIQMSFYGFDNSYMLDMMGRHPGVFSGVGVLDEKQNPRETALALGRKGVRGFRIRPDGRSPDRWLGGDGMAALWKCAGEQRWAVCPLVDPEFLPSLDRMCRRFPATPVVIDHFARIGVDGPIREADVDNLCRFADHENVWVKASAFYALGRKRAPYLDLEPMLRRVRTAFGPRRVMWASDCPFQVMNGHTYRDAIELIRQRLDFLTATDRDWLLRKTAEHVFFT